MADEGVLQVAARQASNLSRKRSSRQWQVYSTSQSFAWIDLYGFIYLLEIGEELKWAWPESGGGQADSDVTSLTGRERLGESLVFTEVGYIFGDTVSGIYNLADLGYDQDIHSVLDEYRGHPVSSSEYADQ